MESMEVPHAAEKPRRLQKCLLVHPERWTDEQLEFLGFSFPSRRTPVLGPAIDPSVDRRPTRSRKLKFVRHDLNTYCHGSRHAAIAVLFEVPRVYYGQNGMILFRYRQRRHFTKIDCLRLSPIETDPRKAHVAAYVDEAYIRNSRARRATREQQVQGSFVRVYYPNIAALLVAVAQEKYAGYENRVTASVVFSENPTRFTKDPVSEFLVYTAKIPFALLEFLKRPTLDRPDYGAIKVTCVSMPAEPLETLRERIVMVMPDEESDNAEYDSTDEEQESAIEDHSVIESCEKAGKSSDSPVGSSDGGGLLENGLGLVGVSA